MNELSVFSLNPCYSTHFQQLFFFLIEHNLIKNDRIQHRLLLTKKDLIGFLRRLLFIFYLFQT